MSAATTTEPTTSPHTTSRPLVATSSGGIAFGQRLAIPDAATAATQEQAWWLDESTAALVPFPSRLPGVQR
jgi:hypothetical protein